MTKGDILQGKGGGATEKSAEERPDAEDEDHRSSES
jgi:hypothetical protein